MTTEKRKQFQSFKVSVVTQLQCNTLMFQCHTGAAFPSQLTARCLFSIFKVFFLAFGFLTGPSTWFRKHRSMCAEPNIEQIDWFQPLLLWPAAYIELRRVTSANTPFSILSWGSCLPHTKSREAKPPLPSPYLLASLKPQSLFLLHGSLLSNV